MYVLNNLLVESTSGGKEFQGAQTYGSRATIVDPTLLVVVALCICFMGVLFFLDYRTNKKYDALFKAVGTELRDSISLDENVELAMLMRARRGEIDERMRLIRHVDQGRYAWVHIMDQIALSVPADLWIDSWKELDRPDKEQYHFRFSVEGYAASNEILADFIQTLEASPFIAEVDFTISQTKKFGEQTAIQFTLKARTEEPDPTLLDVEALGANSTSPMLMDPASTLSGNVPGTSSLPYIQADSLPPTVPKP